jgi:hypothetical protein
MNRSQALAFFANAPVALFNLCVTALTYTNGEYAIAALNLVCFVANFSYVLRAIHGTRTRGGEL